MRCSSKTSPPPARFSAPSRTYSAPSASTRAASRRSLPVKCKPFERLFKVLLSSNFLPAMRRYVSPGLKHLKTTKYQFKKSEKIKEGKILISGGVRRPPGRYRVQPRQRHGRTDATPAEPKAGRHCGNHQAPGAGLRSGKRPKVRRENSGK